MSQKFTENMKDQFFEALKKNRCHVTKTCEQFDISSRTFYKWMDRDKDLLKRYEEIKEDNLKLEIENAELSHRYLRDGVPAMDDDGNLLGWIEKPDRQAVENFLKAFAKHRGWDLTKDVNVTGSLTRVPAEIIKASEDSNK